MLQNNRTLNLVGCFSLYYWQICRILTFKFIEMKITITTTVFDKGKKSQTSENVQKNDLRIEMLANVHSLFNTYKILDCVFDYECSVTKFGYRITKTIVQHKITKHTTVQKISYN